MSLLSLAILAVIQGVTEFLPISSSGHLALFPALTGGEDQGLTIDVAVHVGTLAAVIAYFWRDASAMARGALAYLAGRRDDPDATLAFRVALATVPLVIVGVVVALSGFDEALRSVAVIGWATLGYGILLWIADRWGPSARRFEDWTFRDAMLMGLAQALAVVPGTSRSGITMTVARALGYSRVASARLSMLMSMPAVAAAGGYIGAKLVASGDLALGADAGIGAALAFVSALAALAVMMRMLRDWTMTPFVIYRLALGSALLWVAYA